MTTATTPDTDLVRVATDTIAAALKARSLADIEWAGAWGGYLDGRVAVIVQTGHAPTVEAVYDAINTVLDTYQGADPAADLPILGRALAHQLHWQ